MIFAQNSVPDDLNTSLSRELPFDCVDCGEFLCLREKTINLALNNTEIMYCLKCLGLRENKNPEELLAKIKKYIMARDCFKKEWIKYKDISFCPKQLTCFPNTCFAKK
jgi:hypothetical protein